MKLDFLRRATMEYAPVPKEVPETYEGQNGHEHENHLLRQKHFITRNRWQATPPVWIVIWFQSTVILFLTFAVVLLQQHEMTCLHAPKPPYCKVDSPNFNFVCY